jgi:hypothetical protein
MRACLYTYMHTRLPHRKDDVPGESIIHLCEEGSLRRELMSLWDHPGTSRPQFAATMAPRDPKGIFRECNTTVTSGTAPRRRSIL